MESLFVYNRPVSGKHFIGRRQDLALFANLLSQGENIVIYEPAKSGKMSLVQQCFTNMSLAKQQFSVVQQSLLSVRKTADLCLQLGSAVISCIGSTPDDYAQAVGMYLKDTHFIFDPNIYAASGNILSLSWDIDDKDINAIFTLPYKLAADLGQKIYLCIEEFQNIMLTEDGDKLCRMLEAVFRARTTDDRNAVSYIFIGSQINAMKDIFEHHHRFRKDIERLSLSPIDPKDATDHVIKGFLSTGKVMDRDLMLGICMLFRCNMWYINWFAAICDSLSKGYMMAPVLEEALQIMIAQNEPHYIAVMNDLTTYQVSLLRAVVDGVTRFSAAEVIQRYGLNSSANVRRLKDALCKKEIVSFDENDIPTIIDPLFKYWVEKCYFKIPD